MTHLLSRRTAIAGGALLTAAPGLLRAAPSAPGSVCAATPQATEGPFWFDPDLKRADITEDVSGLPLRLRVDVLDAAGGCSPIENARVDIWQCDAAGLYSGYSRQGFGGRTDARGETFLRGWQPTDAGGRAEFATIYPGAYSFRATHIHVKVFLDAENALTAQIYFPEDISRSAYRGRDLYADSLPNVRANARDRIFNRQGGATMLAEMGEEDGVLTASVAAVVRG